MDEGLPIGSSPDPTCPARPPLQASFSFTGVHRAGPGKRLRCFRKVGQVALNLREAVPTTIKELNHAGR